MKDYYKILGVDKSASKEDIKKAFRKLAHQHHPDKNSGNDESSKKFKEASEAYSVLSDDQKRKQYDTFGSAGPGAGGFGGFNPNDFGGFDFSGFQNGQNGVEFDLGDLFGDFFGGGRSRNPRQQKGRDITMDIKISFEESVFGVEKDILLTKTSACLTCSGSGATPGTGFDTCQTCNGKGKINETRRSFIGVFSTTRACHVCHGGGKVPKEKCSTCGGEGVVERQQEITAKIPSGIEDGEIVRLGGMGEAVPHGIPGDLYLRIHIKPHQSISKEGPHLTTEMPIKLTQAIAGAEVMLKTLDGDIVLKIPEGSNNGDILRLKGKGVPDQRGNRGDFLIRLKVTMPRKLSKESKKAIDILKQEGI